MTFQEMIQEAMKNGFNKVNDGAETWDIENFASENAADERDFSLDYDGNVSVYDAAGYIVSPGVFTFEKEAAPAIVQGFEVVRSEWPNEDGDYYWTISDGVDEKGEFATRTEANENMGRIIGNWRADS